MDTDEVKHNIEKTISTEEVLLDEGNSNERGKTSDNKRNSTVWKAVFFVAIFLVCGIIINEFMKGFFEGIEQAVKQATEVDEIFPPMEISDPKHWNNYAFFNAFSIFVPITVEKQIKDSQYGKNLANKGLLQLRDDLIIFNQKGLCDFDAEAKEQYCRIMCQYYEGEWGDFLKRDTVVPLDEFDDFIKEMVTNELRPSSRLMGSINRKWVSINNANAIMVDYRRTGYDFDFITPVKCKILLFSDSKRVVKMILAYREKESDMWAKDFEQVLRSFKWIDEGVFSPHFDGIKN
jgi:hypothetical protein